MIVYILFALILEIALKVYIDLKGNLREKCSSRSDAENNPVDVSGTTQGELPLTIKFTQLGLEYIWPANLQTDPVALMKCMNPELEGQLPRPLFGDYKQPFDIKQFFWNSRMYFALLRLLYDSF